MKELIALLSVMFITNACYVSKKASREVKVSINKDFQVIIEKDPKGHFLDFQTAEQYKQNVIDGLTKQLGYKNIVVVTEGQEFNITFDKVVLKEWLSTDTVTDAKSPDKGKVYEITKALVQSSGKVSSVDGKKSESFTADKSKNEKLTNLFPPGATIDGRKPGPNDWRKKAFDSFEYRDLAYDLGYRTGDVVTNRVNRFIK